MIDYKELVGDLRMAGRFVETEDGSLETYLLTCGKCDEIADLIENLVKEYNELDKAHDEMFLELCKVKKERDKWHAHAEVCDNAEKEIESLKFALELEKAQHACTFKERDAAISDLQRYARRCRICAHFNSESSEIADICKTCKNYDEHFFESHWIWGGPRE